MMTQAWQAEERGDFRRAVRLYRAAFRAGDASAGLNLGVLVLYGQGTARSKTKARSIFRAAYRRGDAAAASNIANTYERDGEFGKAIEWYERAIEKGDDDARLDLAKILLGLGRDTRTAKRHLRVLAKSRSATRDGVEKAQSLLASLGRTTRRVADAGGVARLTQPSRLRARVKRKGLRRRA